eukprot:symbB.v1.2.013540.t1/scaffold961.1/size148688/12
MGASLKASAAFGSIDNTHFIISIRKLPSGKHHLSSIEALRDNITMLPTMGRHITEDPQISRRLVAWGSCWLWQWPVSADVGGPAPLSLLAAVAMVRGSPWRRQLRGSRWRLYRGEAIMRPMQPMRLQPTPDLLDEATYGSEGVKYFQWLEKELQTRQGAPLVKNGHLGGDAQQAAHWGEACVVWPLGEVRYAWPTDVECFYQSGKGAKRLRVNEGLQDALQNHHEVLFESEGYVAVPSTLEEDFEEELASLEYR